MDFFCQSLLLESPQRVCLHAQNHISISIPGSFIQRIKSLQKCGPVTGLLCSLASLPRCNGIDHQRPYIPWQWWQPSNSSIKDKDYQIHHCPTPSSHISHEKQEYLRYCPSPASMTWGIRVLLQNETKPAMRFDSSMILKQSEVSLPIAMGIQSQILSGAVLYTEGVIFLK